MKEFIIDGKNVNSLSDFVWEILHCLAIAEGTKDREKLEKIKADPKNEKTSLDQLNDYIHDLTPTDEHIILRIINSDKIRDLLGYDSYASLHKRSSEIYKKNFPKDVQGAEMIKADLERAEGERGPTIFDIIIGMILENHKIHLRLE